MVGASKVARDITEEKGRGSRSRKRTSSEIANRARLQLLESERAARAEAERANRIKDEFLATLSHEVRTPLNAVLGWSNLLQIESPKPEDLKQGLEAIERNARVQAQIIEDLLDMSRIISGKVHLVQRDLITQSFASRSDGAPRPTRKTFISRVHGSAQRSSV